MEISATKAGLIAVHLLLQFWAPEFSGVAVVHCGSALETGNFRAPVTLQRTGSMPSYAKPCACWQFPIGPAHFEEPSKWSTSYRNAGAGKNEALFLGLCQLGGLRCLQKSRFLRPSSRVTACWLVFPIHFCKGWINVSQGLQSTQPTPRIFFAGPLLPTELRQDFGRYSLRCGNSFALTNMDLGDLKIGG